METEDGKRLAESVEESAGKAHELAAAVREQTAAVDAETRVLLEQLADEVDAVAAEMLEMRDRIPDMEAESLYLRAAAVDAEERGEQVPAPGTVEAEEWESARLKEMPSPGGQAPGWGRSCE